MKRLFFILVFIVPVLACNRMPVYTDKNAAVEDRVEDLLGQMTLDEKLDQIVGDSSYRI